MKIEEEYEQGKKDAQQTSSTMEQVDLIDRQAVIDALTHKWDGMVTSVFDVVNSLPSAQPEVLACGEGELSAQPEIIRCGECKWYGRTDKRRFYRGMDCLNKHIDTIIPDRDFCSRAERRTDETTI